MLVHNLYLKMIESVSSFEIAKALDRECSNMSDRKSGSLSPIEVLVQVRPRSTEGGHHGVLPEEAFELAKYIRDECQYLKFSGLMSMGEIGDVEEFRIIRRLKTKMLQEFTDFINEDHFIVSMGTIADYELAIIEGGSNQIRLPTALFELRNYDEIEKSAKKHLSERKKDDQEEE